MMRCRSKILSFPKHLIPIAASTTMMPGLIFIGLMNPLESWAQAPPPLAFEVASVRASDLLSGYQLPQFQGERLTSNAQLFAIIASAYNLGHQSLRLSGGPAWTRSTYYRIEAVAARESIPIGLTAKEHDDKMRLMLKTLLADRFKLKVRYETKELPVYAVVVAKNGPKLQKAKIEEKDCSALDKEVSCHNFLGGRGRGLHGKAVDLSDLARYVENWTDRPLVDRTGIKGLFEIDTKPWLPLQPGPPPPAGTKAEDGSDYSDLPMLFTVFESLGLKLQSQKALVEVLVIDHVERPSSN